MRHLHFAATLAAALWPLPPMPAQRRPRLAARAWARWRLANGPISFIRFVHDGLRTGYGPGELRDALLVDEFEVYQPSLYSGVHVAWRGIHEARTAAVEPAEDQRPRHDGIVGEVVYRARLTERRAA